MLRLTDLACQRGNRLLFERLHADLSAGHWLEVRGPNGSGKTSLLRLIAGLGEPVVGRIEHGGRLSWMGHAPALKPLRTPRQELGFWCTGDINRALQAFELETLADLPCRRLSAGQARRVALARVLASDATLWLLDEPTTGLDAASVARFEAVLSAHLAGGGAAVIATHLPLAVAGCQLLELGQ